MSGAPTRVFIARLAGTAVFDPIGRPGRPGARRRRRRCASAASRRACSASSSRCPAGAAIFVPMTRVTSIDAGQVITTGLVNMRRFEQRPTETLVLGELLDRTVTLARGRRAAAVVEDVAMEQQRTRDWAVTTAVRPATAARAAAPPRRGADASTGTR